MLNYHGRQTGLKSGGAERNFETYLVKSPRLIDHQPMRPPNFQDFETKKSAGAPEPPAPPSLTPLSILIASYFIAE